MKYMKKWSIICCALAFTACNADYYEGFAFSARKQTPPPPAPKYALSATVHALTLVNTNPTGGFYIPYESVPVVSDYDPQTEPRFTISAENGSLDGIYEGEEFWITPNADPAEWQMLSLTINGENASLLDTNGTPQRHPMPARDTALVIALGQKDNFDPLVLRETEMNDGTIKYEAFLHFYTAFSSFSADRSKPPRLILLKDLIYSSTSIIIGNDCSLTSADDGYSITDVNFMMSGGKLTLSNITLDGGSSNNNPLITVTPSPGGAFVMEEGTILRSRENRNGNGGAVYLQGYTSTPTRTFIMKGGEINDCSAKNGGAVYVGAGTEFIMEGGIISQNHAKGSGSPDYRDGNGGGVCIEDGTMIMRGGVIWNNDARDGCNPSGGGDPSGGGGVYVIGGSFTMEDGQILSNDTNAYGHGVLVGYGGNFVMKGGHIEPPTDVVGSNGVFVFSGNFTMEESAAIDSDNNVGLFNGVISIGSLNAPFAARIKPWNYTLPVTVLVPKPGYTLTTADLAKFTVVPNGEQEYYLTLEGGNGVLAER
ncbi:MAG: hypothetical protein LBD22_01730 [Spirochaetaceae bacterium]|jgi:hypothetical protein|nr:hypothetical protein [Spirochaetaceae bacterium]